MINKILLKFTLALEISNSAVSRSNFLNHYACYNMKEVIVTRKIKFNIIKNWWFFKTSTETIILCGYSNLLIFKLDLNGIPGSGFILKSHSLSLISQIF